MNTDETAAGPPARSADPMALGVAAPGPWHTGQDLAYGPVRGVPAPGLIQRSCPCGGASESYACDNGTAGVQRAALAAVGPAVVPPIVVDVLRTPGTPLPAALRASFERAFDGGSGRITAAASPARSNSVVSQPGDVHEREAETVGSRVSRQVATADGLPDERPLGHGFSQVRIHTDEQAARSAQALNAKAYTVGSHIVFGPAAFSPDTATGRDLLAHELTHVLQQRLAGPAGPSARVAPIAGLHRAETLGTKAPRSRPVEARGRGSISLAPLLQRLDVSSDGINGDAASTDSVSPGDDNMSIAPPPDFALDLTGTPTEQYALADLRVMDPDFMPGMPEEPSPRQTNEPDTLMAMRLIDGVQRQPAPTGLPDKPAGAPGAAVGDGSDGPHLSTDQGAGWAYGATFPWTLTTTVVYRNLNYRTFSSVLRGLDILHEPQATFLFSIAPSSILSAQLGVGLVNLHIPSLFGTELETQLLAQAQYDAAQGTSVGGSVQLEQHIWKGISATFNLSGMWTVPTPDTPASFQIAPSGGLVVHTDAF